MKHLSILLCIIICTTFACKKDQISLPITEERLPLPINVETIIYRAPYLYAGGGKYRSGAVFRRKIDSADWEIVGEFPQKINEIVDHEDKLIFLGDSILVTKYDIATRETEIPYHYEYFVPYPKTVSNLKRGIVFDNGLVCVSEFNQIAGNIYHSPDNGNSQYVKLQEDNGLYCIKRFCDDSALICGYGQIFALSLRNWNTSMRNISGEIFTSIAVQENQTLVCTFSGDIFRSTDNGISWSKRFESGKNRNRTYRLNEIAYIDEQSAVAAGENGGILMSKDGGNSWSEIKNSCHGKLLSVTAVNNIIYIGGSDGSILQISEY